MKGKDCDFFVVVGSACSIEERHFQVSRRPECIQRAALHRNSEDQESVPGNVSLSSTLDNAVT